MGLFRHLLWFFRFRPTAPAGKYLVKLSQTVKLFLDFRHPEVTSPVDTSQWTCQHLRHHQPTQRTGSISVDQTIQFLSSEPRGDIS